MTTREQRREEYSASNVVRVLHPTRRPLSPVYNAATDFDNNLDYLLDDLQSSVTRTANTLNNSNTSNKSRDVQYLSPSNTTSVFKERSVSPGRDGQKIYKTAHYEYSTSSSGGGVPQGTGVQTNVNQLDSLLLDLKHERDNSLERNKQYSNVGIDSGLLEPSTRVTHSSRSYTTNATGGSTKPNAVNRELHFESPSGVQNLSTLRQSRSRQRSPTYEKNIETKVTRDVSYDSDPVLDNVISTSNRSYNYSNKNEHQIVPYNDDATNFPKELNGVPLSGDLLPGPGTKVTTTIKTFTYEIPNDAPIPTNKTLMYKNEAYNSTNTSSSMYPERDLPHNTSGSPHQTTSYKTETYNTINRSDNSYGGYPPHQRPVSPEPVTNKMVYKRDIHETSSNVYPVPGRGNPPQVQSPPPSSHTTIYKHDVTNTNTNIHHPPAGGVPVYPYNPNNTIPTQGHPGPGPTQTYIYKHETTNTKNTLYGPPGNDNGQPNERYGYPVNALPQQPHQGYPSEPSTTTYKYTTNTTTRNVHGNPDDRQPLLAPFPTDGLEQSHVDGNPPKRLDDLLATFDNPDGRGPNGRPPLDEPHHIRRREVNTALATGKAPVTTVDPKVPTKNIAGPPVYYPPGHELFSKNEQSAAAWRAQGGYANASGKYEYESASKSKSSSKSGAAVVPVCLPLCCAMPCSIM